MCFLLSNLFIAQGKVSILTTMQLCKSFMSNTYHTKIAIITVMPTVV